MKKTTLTQIAKLVGVTPQYMWMIARGVRRPNWKRAKQLSVVIPGHPPQFWMEATSEQILDAIKHAQQPDPQTEAAA